MKKINVLSLLMFISTFSVIANNKKTQPVPKEVNIDSVALQLALNVGDYDKAITFSYRILATNPNDLNNIYSLAQLYYAASNFEMSIKICSILSNLDTLDTKVLELAALNFVSLKDTINAIQLYKVMNEKFKNSSYLYQAAVLLFQIKKTDECIETLQTILNNTLAKDAKIIMSRKNTVDKIIQEEINLFAAAYNMLGFINYENNNYPDAKNYFEKALAIEPNFILADNNLKELLKKEK